jgi:site-specific DNA recombinase
MEKLDNLVAEHIAERLLQPEPLEEILASVLDRRQERAEHRREHIAELNKRASETDLRLKRLYDAIEAGVADLGDPALKERIARGRDGARHFLFDYVRARGLSRYSSPCRLFPR